MAHQPCVQILMGTFNGATYLQAQLDSIARQTWKNWRLWISDDGSQDGTLAIIYKFAQSHPVKVLNGPRLGLAQNYLSMLCHPELPKGPIALCDQDDVWMSHHLHTAMHQLAGKQDLIAAYASRTIETAADLSPHSLSRLHDRGPSFNNAIVQNVLAGNTLVMNERALELLRTAGEQPDIPYHDWWIYLLLSAANADIFINPDPCVYYRQHKTNRLGARSGLVPLLRRCGLILNGTHADWIQRNLAALADNAHLIAPENREILEAVMSSRHEVPMLKRLVALREIGLHRQRRFEHAAVNYAVIKGWL